MNDLLTDTRLVPETIGGVPCVWYIPNNAPEDRAILYLHGGGFAKMPFSADYCEFAARLAKDTGVKALYVDYRLIPEYFFPCHLEDCGTAYAGLLEKAENVLVFGESAGANLALVLSLWSHAYGLPQPKAIAAVSPPIKLYRAVVGKRYAHGRDPAAPFISPISGDLSCLPPTYIQTGGLGGIEQLIIEDSILMAEKAEKQGASIKLDINEELEHVFVTHENRTEPEEAGYQRLLDFIRAHF